MENIDDSLLEYIIVYGLSLAATAVLAIVVAGALYLAT
jgi:hypothetical protein